MTISTTSSPRFQVATDGHWKQTTSDYRDGRYTLVLERHSTYVEAYNAPGSIGYLFFRGERHGKGAGSRARAKTLLKDILAEGKEQKWGEPHDIVAEDAPMALAVASYTSLNPASKTTSYNRLWKVAKGRLFIHVEFAADSWVVEPEEVAMLIEASEQIVRSINFNPRTSPETS
jgi:hypothetical protein